MMEFGSCNELANTWPNVAREHHGVMAWLMAFLRLLGIGLRAATPLMAGICPLYTALDVVLRGFHQPLDPISWMALIGTGICVTCLPFYLTSSPERRLSMTTGLLIGVGLVAGLVEVWISG